MTHGVVDLEPAYPLGILTVHNDLTTPSRGYQEVGDIEISQTPHQIMRVRQLTLSGFVASSGRYNYLFYFSVLELNEDQSRMQDQQIIFLHKRNYKAVQHEHSEPSSTHKPNTFFI